MSSEGVESGKSLRLRSVRTRWQILALQLVATASLAALVLTMTSKYGECDQDFIQEADGENYWCPAFEHTRGIVYVEDSFQRESILPDIITGADQIGNSSLLFPTIFCLLLTGTHAYISSRGTKFRRRLRAGFYLSLIHI